MWSPKLLFSFVVLICLLVVGAQQPSRESINAIYKQINGPVSEGQVELKSPKPEDIRHTSSHSLKRLSVNGEGQTTFKVEKGKQTRFVLLFKDDTVADSYTVSVAPPVSKGRSGDFVSTDGEVRRGALVRVSEKVSDAGINAASRGFLFSAVSGNAGLLSVKVNKNGVANGAEDVVVLYATSSSYRLQVITTSLDYIVGEPITVKASLFNSAVKSQSPTGQIDQGTLDVHFGGESRSFAFTAEDDSGWVTATFIPSVAGKYIATIDISGLTPEGDEFERSQQLVFDAVKRTVHISGTAEIDDDGVDAYLAISVDTPADSQLQAKYLMYGELYGTGANGLTPITYITGLSDVVNGTLQYAIHGDWLASTDARGPYSLLNVRITDVDTHNVLARADRIPIRGGSGSLLGTRAAARAVDVTLEMRQGRKPNRGRRLLTGGHVVLLIHGYCASSNQFPTSQFSNYAQFNDLNQARSHDYFANLIWSFGSTYDGYGAVVHSQGGCASLHLYTYYWSGFDYVTSGNRLIQSVGTPYQGTALAGNLALLGQVFGVGCGSVTDLTYSGASTWLSGIPSWARGQVYFYTTSFTDNWWSYDYCNMATDVVLSDPDDGTTEQWAGALTYANSMGHTTGWCHTTGMRDPPQCTDSSRNSVMNSNAKR